MERIKSYWEHESIIGFRNIKVFCGTKLTDPTRLLTPNLTRAKTKKQTMEEVLVAPLVTLNIGQLFLCNIQVKQF